MLRIRDAKKTFFAGTPDEKLALNGLNLTLEKGDFATIIGSNGAGKSTLLNAISGALMLDEGTVEIAGQDVTRVPVHKRANLVARVFQDPMKGTAAGMSIAENMLLAEMRQSRPGLRLGLTRKRLDWYREQLSHLRLGLEDRMDTQVSLLSGGQRQSLSLVMAVMDRPALLLLDEHTAALDPRTAALVLEATLGAVNALHLTTLMVSHNMSHAVDHGNRILMLEAGRIKLDISGEEKARSTVKSLTDHFAVKSDRMLLEA
ncbi:ABC transporter ATP-binding protein [Arenibacterium sp. LLYu02]|uniref:ABC transporter ATP-binding protein n=1 Tax=Arenibacterium sp. LLYu02 TaxID=3404132 RepID=UPI003B215263